MAVRVQYLGVILSLLTALPASADDLRQVTIAVPEPMVASASGIAAPVEIVREAYRRIGIEMKTMVVPSERSVRAANSGEADGDMLQPTGIEADYPSLVRVPEPVISLDLVAISTGLDVPVNGWNSLAPYKICVVRGMKVIEAGTAEMQRVVVNTLASALSMLKAGRCDLALFVKPTWQDVDRLQMGSFHELSPAVTTLSFYHYVNRRNTGLVPKLAAALAEMRRDGTTAAVTAADDRATATARQRSLLSSPSD
jgi:polar amino acid transport system substrate-binding protein